KNGSPDRHAPSRRTSLEDVVKAEAGAHGCRLATLALFPHLLQGEEIGLRRLEGGGDRPQARLPRTSATPQVPGEDAQAGLYQRTETRVHRWFVGGEHAHGDAGGRGTLSAHRGPPPPAVTRRSRSARGCAADRRRDRGPPRRGRRGAAAAASAGSD